MKSCEAFYKKCEAQDFNTNDVSYKLNMEYQMKTNTVQSNTSLIQIIKGWFNFVEHNDAELLAQATPIAESAFENHQIQVSIDFKAYLIRADNSREYIGRKEILKTIRELYDTLGFIKSGSRYDWRSTQPEVHFFGHDNSRTRTLANFTLDVTKEQNVEGFKLMVFHILKNYKRVHGGSFIDLNQVLH